MKSAVVAGCDMAARKAERGTGPKTARRNRGRLVVCAAGALLALGLPEAPLAVPKGPAARRPPSPPPPALASLPEPAARPLRQEEFDLIWRNVKYSMAACEVAVAEAELEWRARREPPTAAAIEKARQRCARASVEVGEAALPTSARGGVRLILEQARDACERSMIDKQLGLFALRSLAAAPPDSLEAYEARLRMEAGSRGTLNCAASFAEAAEAARLSLSEMELASS